MLVGLDSMKEKEMPKKEQGGDDMYDSIARKIKRVHVKGKSGKYKLRKRDEKGIKSLIDETKRQDGKKSTKKTVDAISRRPSSENKMKFKIKGKKETYSDSSKLIEPKDSEVKRAKIKIKPLSKSVKPIKEGKIIIRKGGEGKYVKDENYYKAKMMRAETADEEKKYFRLMKKTMDK